MRISDLATLGVLLLAGTIVAQGRVIIVDAANRPGTDFKNIPPAVAAATDGDIIRVRDGSYTGFTTSKALSVIGEPNALITIPANPFFEVIRIRNLPAGKRFTLEGFDLSAATRGPPNSVYVIDCQGQVLIENIQVRSVRIIGHFGVNTLRSRHVTVTGSTFRRASVRCDQGTMLLTDTECVGNNAWAGHGLFPPSAGAQVSNGELVISRCNLTGGDTISGFPQYNAAAGLLVWRSRVTVTDDGSRSIRAGGGPTGAAPAIEGLGTLIIDPGVKLVPAAGGSQIDPRLTTTRRAIPSLRATGAPPGGTVVVELASKPGDSIMLLVGFRGDRVVLPGLGDVWLNLNSLLVTAAIGVQGASGRFPLSIRVPSVSGLVSATFTWQGISGTQANGFNTSNPSTYVHD